MQIVRSNGALGLTDDAVLQAEGDVLATGDDPMNGGRRDPNAPGEIGLCDAFKFKPGSKSHSSEFTPGVNHSSIANLHPVSWTVVQCGSTILGMAKAVKKRATYARWFLREWRKDRALTLEQLASRIESTAASVSRLERGQQPYSQPILEALASALRCEPADLIMRPPGASDRLRAVFEAMKPEQQKQALAVMEALKGNDKKTEEAA